jgi:hypothetical protein
MDNEGGRSCRPEAKRVMLGIADGCEEMAKLAEARYQGCPASDQEVKTKSGQS